jgi:hypothetical protein
MAASAPVTLEAVEQLRIRCLTGRGLAEHDDVESRQCRLVRPKRFANDTLDPVSRRGSATVLLGDREPELKTRSNAAASSRRLSLPSWNSGPPACRPDDDYGVSLARPLARRRFRTRRPALVDIRARKP